MLQRLSSLSPDELRQENVYIELESEWLDDYQYDLNKFIGDQLKRLSDYDLSLLANKLIRNNVNRDVYEVETPEEAFNFLKQMQNHYDTDWDTMFFESQFEPEFRNYLLTY